MRRSSPCISHFPDPLLLGPTCPPRPPTQAATLPSFLPRMNALWGTFQRHDPVSRLERACHPPPPKRNNLADLRCVAAPSLAKLQHAFLSDAEDSPNQVPTCHSGLKTARMHAEWVHTVDTKSHCSTGLWGGGASDVNSQPRPEGATHANPQSAIHPESEVRPQYQASMHVMCWTGPQRHKSLRSNPPQLDRV